MIIERLDLIAFGGFTDKSIDLSGSSANGSHDRIVRMHVVYGPNESGKSTSLRAIQSLLYGIPSRSEDNYLHPNAKMRVGGKLSDGDGFALECVRRKGRKSTLRDVDDSTVLEDSILDRMLGGIDIEAFTHRFGLSHEELVRGGESILAGEGDLGSILFAAGAGVGRLRSVQEELLELSTRLYVPSGTKGSINQSLRELSERKQQMEQAKILPNEFHELREQRDAASRQVEELNTALKARAVLLAKLEAVEKALPLVPQWHAIRQSLSKVCNAPRLDDAFTDRRRSAMTNLDVAEQQIANARTRINEWTEELAALGDDPTIRVHEAEIESLFQQLGAREEARSHQTALESKRSNMDRRMSESLQNLSIPIQAMPKKEVSEQIDAAIAKLRVVDSVRTKVNDLARRFAMLDQQQKDADELVRTLEKKLAIVQQRLEKKTAPEDPNTISQTLESVGAPEIVLADLAQQKSDVRKRQSRCEQLTGKLTGFEGTFTQAVQLRLPNESAIAVAEQELTRQQKALSVATERLLQAKKQQQEAVERLESARSLGVLPTQLQLDDSRNHRDELLCTVIAENESGSLKASTLGELKKRIRVADELVDAMRMHHEQLHRQASLVAELQRIETQVSRYENDRVQAETACEAANQAWLTLWNQCQVRADAPEQMHRWLTTHSQLAEAVAGLEEATSRLTAFEDRILLGCERLRRVIEAASAVAQESGGNIETSVDTVSDFSTLYDQAACLRGRLRIACKQYEELVNSEAALREQLPQAQAQLQTRQRELDQWHHDWAGVTSALAENLDRTPAVVTETITQIDALCAQQRERDILALRIRSIQDDDRSYRNDVGRLASELQVDVPEAEGDISNVFKIVKELYQRLQSERIAVHQRKTLNQQVDALQKQLVAATNQATESRAMLNRLCEEAGVSAAERLIEVERESSERLEHEKSLQSIEQQLRIMSGSVAIETFVAEVENQKPELVQLEINQKRTEFEQTEQSLSTAQQELGALQHRIGQIDGSGRASDLSQEMQLIAGKTESDIEQYARVKVAAFILRQAIEHYRQENQGPVIEKAGEIFSRLTCGEYDSLKVDVDPKGRSILYGSRNNRQLPDVPADAMSTGTADALYLALRLSSIDHQLSRGHAMPLIVDDCLVQLDDDRATAALRTLCELSARTQVILFTHHRHLVELASQSLGANDYQVHWLAGQF